MKMKLNFFWIAVLGLLLTLNSCKKSSSTFSVIPKDTKAVLVVDVKSIYDKADLKNIGDYSFYNTGMKELQNENKDGAEFIETFLDDPAVSGINLLDDIFVYYVKSGSDDEYVVFALPLQKSEKFEKWLKDLFDKAEEDFDVQKNGNYKYITPDDDISIAWNKGAALIVKAKGYDSDVEKELETLMTLKKEDQISNNNDFVDFYSDKKDVSFWMDYELLSDIDNDYDYVSKEMNMNFDDMSMSAYLDFLDGEINLSMKVDIPDDNPVAKLYDAKFNADILKYAPEKTFGVLSFALNTDALYDYLKTIPSIGDADEQLENQIGFNLKDIVNSFKGSFFVDISGFEEKEVEYTDYSMDWNENTGEYEYKETPKIKNQMVPQGIFAFDINDSKVFDSLLKSATSAGQLTDENGYYSMPVKGTNIYFGFNSDVFVLSLDDEAMEKFKSGGYSDNLASADEGSEIKNNTYYMKLFLDLNKYPSVVADEIATMKMLLPLLIIGTILLIILR